MTTSDRPHPGAITEAELLLAQGCGISADLATKFRSLFWGGIRPIEDGNYRGITITTNTAQEPQRLFEWSDPVGYRDFLNKLRTEGLNAYKLLKEYHLQCPRLHDSISEMDACSGSSARFLLDFWDKSGITSVNLYSGEIPDAELLNLHTPYHLEKVLRSQEQLFRQLYPQWSEKYGCRYLGAGRDDILLRPPVEAHDLDGFLAAARKAEFHCTKFTVRADDDMISLTSKM